MCHIARPTSKEMKTDRHNVFIRLFIKLTHYFRYAARKFAIWISTGTYDISFIVYRFTSLISGRLHISLTNPGHVTAENKPSLSTVSEWLIIKYA